MDYDIQRLYYNERDSDAEALGPDFECLPCLTWAETQKLHGSLDSWESGEDNMRIIQECDICPSCYVPLRELIDPNLEYPVLTRPVGMSESNV